MPFTKDSARDDITRELLTGATPGQLSKVYPVKSVYRIYNELLQAGLLSKAGFVPVETADEEEDLDIPDLRTGQPSSSATSATPTVKTKTKVSGQVGAEIVSFPGDVAFPSSAVDRIRGILGITMRPKVLSCPMPELLYPSMVIAVNDFGFPPMRPDDFIDTVLYQWLESCDVIPYAYIKKSEAEEFAKKYGVSEDNVKDYAKQHGLMTEVEFAEKYGIVLSQELEEAETVEVAEPLQEEEPEPEKENSTEGIPSEEGANKERKSTVGDLLKRLNISNIQQEVANNDGAERHTEPDSPQGNNESRE